MTTSTQANRQRRQLYGEAIGPLRSGEWEITESGGSVAVRLNPEHDRLPNDATVVAIVDFNLRRQVFDCGTVGSLQTPRSRDGGDSRLVLGSRMLKKGRHKLRIIDPNRPNFCIAWGARSNAEVILPVGRGSGNGQGIAIRKVADLGDAATRLELDPGEERPTVEINETQNEPLFRALKQGRNPALAALFFPCVVDAILRQLAIDHLAGMTKSNQSAGGWRAEWLGWSKDVLRLEIPPLIKDAVTDLQALDDWRKQIMDLACGSIGRQGQAAAIGSWPETPGDAV